MSIQKKLSVAALLLLALVGGWWTLDRAGAFRSDPAKRGDVSRETASVESGDEAKTTNATDSEASAAQARAHLTGVVVDSRDGLVGGARVVAWPVGLDRSVGLSKLPSEAAQTRSGEDGRFSLDLTTHHAAWTIYAEKSGSGSTLHELAVTGADVELRLETSAQLGGRVLNAQGEPIAGARIRWMGCFAGIEMERQARSGADGRYAIEVAPLAGGFLVGTGSGGAAVEVVADGHAPLLVPLDYWYFTVPVQMVQDFVLVRGRSIRGRVVDAETGHGLPGATIHVWSELFRRWYYTQNGRLEYSYSVRALERRTTDEGGHFEVACIPEAGFHPLSERLHVGAVHPGYQRESVVLAKDDKVPTFRLRRTGTIEGRVVDPRGDPLPRVEVGFIESDRRHAAAWPEQAGVSSANVTTDQDGRYRLDAPEAIVRVTATRDGVRSSVEVKARSDRTVQAQELVLADAEPPRLSVRVLDASATPIAGATVQLLPGPAFARTGQDGWARTTPTKAEDGATVVVVARAPGFAPRVSDPFVYSSAPTELTLSLERGSTLTGQVAWEDGSPGDRVKLVVYDGTVSLEIASGQERMKAEAERLAPILYAIDWTGQDGSFSVAGLPPGPYHVSAMHLGAQPPTRVTRSNVDASRPVTLTLPDSPPEVPSSVVEGSVRADGGGQLPDDYTVQVLQGTTRAQARRVSLGRYRYEPLSAGLCTIRATARGYVPFEQDIELGMGETAQVDVVFRRGAEVELALPEPLPDGAVAYLTNEESGDWFAGDRDSTRIVGVPPGRYRAWIRLPNRQTLVPREPTPIEVRDAAARPKVSVDPVTAGVVLAPAGLKAAFVDSSDRVVATCRNGGAVYLPAGRYTVKIESDPAREVSIEVVASKSVKLGD